MIKRIIKISTFATFQQPYMDPQEIYNIIIVRVHHRKCSIKIRGRNLNHLERDCQFRLHFSFISNFTNQY